MSDKQPNGNEVNAPQRHWVGPDFPGLTPEDAAVERTPMRRFWMYEWLLRSEDAEFRRQGMAGLRASVADLASLSSREAARLAEVLAGDGDWETCLTVIETEAPRPNSHSLQFFQRFPAECLLPHVEANPGILDRLAAAMARIPTDYQPDDWLAMLRFHTAAANLPGMPERLECCLSQFRGGGR